MSTSESVALIINMRLSYTVNSMRVLANLSPHSRFIIMLRKSTLIKKGEEERFTRQMLLSTKILDDRRYLGECAF